MLHALLYWAVYLSGWAALRHAAVGARPDSAPRPSAWGVGLWLVVAVPSLAQAVFPDLLALGRRDPAAVDAGQWWRLLTSMVLQDGGWLGTAFNLVTLAVTVAVVRVVLDGPALPPVFVAGGLVSNLLVLLTFREPGAGSSLATMFLVSLAAVLTRPWHRGGPVGLVPLLALTATTAILLATRDIHGLATSAGLLSGLAVTVATRARA